MDLAGCSKCPGNEEVPNVCALFVLCVACTNNFENIILGVAFEQLVDWNIPLASISSSRGTENCAVVEYSWCEERVRIRK